ncbi:hypothetical protein TIFTF001_006115 [Ficus carica]|uniref:Uncharacterized protein n=1 Tax=Ficus carica TaxID=3494 RepID=A0AA87ZGS8_FICCA|nr:hypothetical protein TIFTF001_006115 [Ficus carica]
MFVVDDGVGGGRRQIRRSEKKLAELLRCRTGGCLTDGPRCSSRRGDPPHARSRAPTVIPCHHRRIRPPSGAPTVTPQ